MPRKPYPTDVSDEEWSFAAPYLVLMTQDAPQREHSLREVFNALRWIVRAGSPWRLLPIHALQRLKSFRCSQTLMSAQAKYPCSFISVMPECLQRCDI